MLLGREIVGIRGMFLITALMPLITFTLSFFVKERRISDRSELKIHAAINPHYITTAVVWLATYITQVCAYVITDAYL